MSIVNVGPTLTIDMLNITLLVQIYLIAGSFNHQSCYHEKIELVSIHGYKIMYFLDLVVVL